MNQEAKLQELNELRAKVRQLEAELEPPPRPEQSEWPPEGFYGAYVVLSGFVLGAFGAMASLTFNIVGSTIVHQHPLQLIQVYLTFPLGESALNIDTGLALAVGCCLYVLTGMVLGIPFQIVLSRWCEHSSLAVRFVVVSLLALVLWIVNFYGLIAWLQPLLFGGNWIIQGIPWWVAATTHLVFGWTMLALQPLSKFVAAR